MIGTATHYFHGRTTPCDDEKCDACDHGVPWRWHGYVSLYGPTTHSHGLFEMTARASEPLKAYREAHGTLRGCMILAKRINASPNARVIITTSVADLQSILLPPEPHILEALSIIWNIPLPAIALDGVTKEVPKAKVAISQAIHRLDPQFAPGNSKHAKQKK